MGNSCFGKGRRQEPRRELVSGWDLRIAQWPLNPSRVGHLTDRWPLLRRTETNHKLSAPLSNFRRPCSIPDSLLFEGIPNSPSQENLIHSTKSEMVSGGKAAHLSSPCTLDSHRLQGRPCALGMRLEILEVGGLLDADEMPTLVGNGSVCCNWWCPGLLTQLGCPFLHLWLASLARRWQ